MIIASSQGGSLLHSPPFPCSPPFGFASREFSRGERRVPPHKAAAETAVFLKHVNMFVRQRTPREPTSLWAREKCSPRITATSAQKRLTPHLKKKSYVRTGVTFSAPDLVFFGGVGLACCDSRCVTGTMNNDGVAASAAAVTAAVEEASTPAQAAQQMIAVPETADDGEGDGQGRPAVSPESPAGLSGSPGGDDGSEASPVSAVPPAAPTPTPNLSPQGGKPADIPGDDAAAPAEARPAPASTPASATASRTICLRTLRGSTSSGALSSLAGWGGPVGVAAAASSAAAAAAAGGAKQGDAGRGSPPPMATSGTDAAGQAGTTAVVGTGVVAGLGVLPTANKVVDLREVKKVKPGPLAASAPPVAPVPAEDSDGTEEGGGPVKIDISAGKRMIEFQLKQNAAEEKREAARLKSERDRAGALSAERRAPVARKQTRCVCVRTL